MNKKKKVVIALSGGVDSSVAAALAVEKNYEVVGVTLRLKHPDAEFSSSQVCASKNDEEVIKKIVALLGIEHIFLDKFDDFSKNVLYPSACEYVAGRTPNPCCICNFFIKFGILTEFAKSIGAEKIMTGHYAKLKEIDNQYYLYRGDDPKKDQSYFLYRLNQEQLSMLEFPVGKLEKTKVREIAHKFNLPSSQKVDSQDACFQVPGESFGETLRRLFSLKVLKGNFIYQGKIVGKHNGIHNYTIGQRKGLGVALGVPAYIKSIDKNSGDIELVTDEELLKSSSFTVDNISLQRATESLPDEFQVQVRYRSKAVDATYKKISSTLWEITPKEKLKAVTSGQAAVFYDGNLLLGGGIIKDVN